jgi:hypothetical protein
MSRSAALAMPATNRAARLRRVWVAALTLVIAGNVHAESASGAINYASKAGRVAVVVKHAYLVKGPDAATGKRIRRIVLSAADAAAKMDACDNMMCSDGGIGEGMTVDLDAGPRLNYWIVANGQRIQYSGTAVPTSLAFSVDTAQRVAGTLTIDDRAAGGPQIRIEFDATLVKEFSKPM